MPTKKLKNIIDNSIKETKIVKPVKKVAKIESAKVPPAPVLPEMEMDEKKSGSNRGALFLGGTVLLIGILLLLGEIFDISFSHFLWPLFIIIPGAIIFLSSLSMGKGGDALAIVGGILTSVGAVLFLQNVTGLWASWAYAWSLVAPTSIGASQLVYGWIKKSESHIKNGWEITKVGLIIFTVGFIFFEMIIGLSGFGLKELGLPVLPIVLIGLGVFILLLALFRKK